jgi:hypothetical protein
MAFKTKEEYLIKLEKDDLSSTKPLGFVHDHVHKQFEQLGNSQLYRNATIENRSSKREFLSIGEDTRCQ